MQSTTPLTNRKKDVILPKEKTANTCLSCGTSHNMKKRKYCSMDCRQSLRQKLNSRSGLLKALNARYATFYFTDIMIILDVLPYGSRHLFSFIYPRLPERNPAEDFGHMANLLGNIWWAEKKRTNKTYLASKEVLDRANRDSSRVNAVTPVELRIPTTKGASILHLKLDKKDLNTSEYRELIKKTYRLQAKKHHPDLGGNSKTFRKIHNAYEDLLNWAESPTFIKRRGFPDKWFYTGERNKWCQPIPVPKKD
ncbi:MAG: DnaJ domain-containing protein [Desulfobacterales bacterium]|nr:DnaJ domain-containing protein [Desulfobacterales bacterium]